VGRLLQAMPTRWAGAALRWWLPAVPACLIPPCLDSSGPALLPGPGAAGGPLGALLFPLGPLSPPSAPAPCASRSPPIGPSTASLRSRLPPVLSVLHTVRSRAAVLSCNVGNERYRRQREGGTRNQKRRNYLLGSDNNHDGGRRRRKGGCGRVCKEATLCSPIQPLKRPRKSHHRTHHRPVGRLGIRCAGCPHRSVAGAAERLETTPLGPLGEARRFAAPARR
jgi:hypothetical protein